MHSWLKYPWTGLYLIFLALGALCLFLYGFFPLKYHTGKFNTWQDMPFHIDEVSIDGAEVYNPGEYNVILMVIDGLRYDFVSEGYMPYTWQLLKNKSACIYASVADPPTVTMPRIKSPERKKAKAQWQRTIKFWRNIYAMMTGSVSTFADVALNFGAPEVRGDNVLKAAHTMGRKMHLYGDDTWLRLFPNLFEVHDGTNSFYVTDYTEVDNNVTRHLDDVLKATELKKPNFNFLVLHYLGLDHIGHLEGARSPKIKPKLSEMDEIVKRIVTAMEKWTESTGVLFLTGDHGMRDAGGHGGASPAEVLVPMVVTESNRFVCPHNASHGGTVAQVDLAPSVTWLLGAPPPAESAGRVLPALLVRHESRRQLYVLHCVGFGMLRLLRLQYGDAVEEKEYYKQFKRAETNFGRFLETQQKSAAMLAREFYNDSLDEMARILTETTVNFDMFAIVVAIILIFMITAALVCVTLYSLQREFIPRYSYPHHLRRTPLGDTIAFLITLICIQCSLTLVCAITETKSPLCTLKPQYILVNIAIAISFTVTYFLVKSSIESNFDLTSLRDLNAIDYLLIFGTLFHSWSFFGTSFIEEEHMTWYFFWNTLMFFVLIRTLVLLVLYFTKKLVGATEVQDKPHLQEKMTAGIGIVPKWILLIALHRYLRTMNQTGDRWLHLPDTADWLYEPENAHYLQAHLLVGTILTLFICLRNLRNTNNVMQINSALTILATACILWYRITTDALVTPFPELKNWDPVHIVNIFWGILIAQMACEVFTYIGGFQICGIEAGAPRSDRMFVYNKPKAKTEDHIFDEDATEPWNSDEVKLNLANSISHLMLQDMMLIIVLLMRPHNVIIVPSVYITCKLTTECLDHKLLDPNPKRKTESLDILSETLVHLWIGSLFFFYQGNSNSLATVDLSAGYVGLREYSPARVAARTGLHAYSGPALAGAALLCALSGRAHSWSWYRHTVWQVTNIFALQRVYSLCVYLVVATVFRHHLFIWSVFSPKLLYDFVATVFTIQALMTVVYIIVLTHLTCCIARIVKLQVFPTIMCPKLLFRVRSYR